MANLNLNELKKNKALPYGVLLANLIEKGKPVQIEIKKTKKAVVLKKDPEVIKKLKERNIDDSFYTQNSKYKSIFASKDGETYFKLTDIFKGQFTTSQNRSEETRRTEMLVLAEVQKLVRKTNEELDYSDLDNSWYESCTESAKIIDKQLRIPSNAIFIHDRTGKTPEGTTIQNFKTAMNIIKRIAGVTKLDTWNPVDLWIFAKGYLEELLEKLKNLDSGKTGVNLIEQVNTILNNGIDNNKVFPISLKKIKPNTAAKFTRINKSPNDTIELDFDPKKISLKFQFNFPFKGFATKASYINATNTVTGKPTIGGGALICETTDGSFNITTRRFVSGSKSVNTDITSNSLGGSVGKADKTKLASVLKKMSGITVPENYVIIVANNKIFTDKNFFKPDYIMKLANDLVKTVKNTGESDNIKSLKSCLTVLEIFKHNSDACKTGTYSFGNAEVNFIEAMNIKLQALYYYAAIMQNPAEIIPVVYGLCKKQGAGFGPHFLVS